MTAQDVEIIVSSHASGWTLELCLLALSRQEAKGFDVCVAEDGESEEVAGAVARAGALPGGLRHVRQRHEGFGKNRILNAAIAGSRAGYLVFLDGDCLPSPGFLGRHLALRRPGRFVTGGVVRLPRAATAAVRPEDVASGDVFRWRWLRSRGVRGLRDSLKAEVWPRGISDALERLTPVEATWNGGNSSGWRSDLLEVNGFDESLGYGGEDVEMGFRLNRLGVAGRHARYTATLVHLHHERPYVDLGLRDERTARIWAARAAGGHRTPRGIVKG